MGQYNNPDFLFSFDLPAVPTMVPASGRAKLWEMEEDNAYLNYLYPQVTRQIREFTEEACDKLEYEGSLMFDVYPDKTSLRLMAGEILTDFRKNIRMHTKQRHQTQMPLTMITMLSEITCFAI